MSRELPGYRETPYIRCGCDINIAESDAPLAVILPVCHLDGNEDVVFSVIILYHRFIGGEAEPFNVREICLIGSTYTPWYQGVWRKSEWCGSYTAKCH
jgi:hypothetical protein